MQQDKPKLKIAAPTTELKASPPKAPKKPGAVEVAPVGAGFFRGEGDRAKEIGCELRFHDRAGTEYSCTVKVKYVEDLYKQYQGAMKALNAQQEAE